MGNSDPKGYYAVLGVSIDADIATIKTAYRRKAMELHPDRNSSADATRQFQFLNEAHAVLTDSAARAEYDAMSAAPPQAPAAAAPEEPEPIVCSSCGKISAQPRYVSFMEAKSFLVVTTRAVIQGIFCSSCAEKKALKASARTWALGWWGFPWGPIYSIQALWTNMSGGKRPVVANARLAAHQAWFFAATGRPEMARAIALDALNLARKIPRNSKEIRRKKTLGYDVKDEGEALRLQIQTLIDALGDSGSLLLKDAWSIARRPFFVQAGVAAAVAIGLGLAIANSPTNAYSPPPGPKPYLTETATNYNAGRKPLPARVPEPTWQRPARAPNGQPWPVLASYVKGFPRGNSDGLSTVTVDNTRNDSDVFVKLVFLGGSFAKPVRSFFIPAHGQFTASSLTSGEYDVRYRNLSTGGLSRSQQFTLREIKDDDGTQYSTVTLTLYQVRDGNMRTYPLAEDEF
jgi:hypothetical protein